MLDTIQAVLDDYLVVIVLLFAVIAGYYYVNTPPPRPKVVQKPVAKPAASLAVKKAAAKKERPVVTEDLSDGKKRVKIFFGSQTGTAQDFSRTLSNEAKRFGMHSEIVDMENYDPEDLANEAFVIFCMSTHGEGQPTDNSKLFYNWLMDSERSPGALSKVEYTVFGLGNRTYEHYNKVARDVDGRMEYMGAKRVFERGEGDDDSSLEEDFIHWKKRLWVSLCEYYNLDVPDSMEDKFKPRFRITYPAASTLPEDEGDGASQHVSGRALFSNTKPRMRPDGTTPIYDIKNPYMARLAVKGELHAGTSDRSCMHIEFEIGDNLAYQPGDHLGVYPENDPQQVDALLKRLGTDPQTVFTLVPIEGGATHMGPCTMQDAFLDAVDITTPPRKAVLRALAEYATSAADKNRLAGLASESTDDYNKFIKGDQRTILEVLDAFPSLTVPPEHLIELLPRLPPRYYSISSSSRANPGKVHVMAVLVQYTTPTGRKHDGVATSWFKKLAVGALVPVFTREATFRMPIARATPMVMVGPGTGLAPFRGFLQELDYIKTKEGVSNPTALFFGCRDRATDFIYQAELEGYVANGVLSHLLLAFSREKSEKVYVQHRMVENKQLIYDMLVNDKGVFYVCGDANQMAKAVQQALKAIIMECGSKSDAEATALLDDMQKQNRYLQDVWF